MTARTVGLIASTLLFFGCPKQVPDAAPPPPPPAAPAFNVPAGCEKPIDGTFVHAQNPSYRYRADDDGGTLLLVVERPMNDGGAQPEDGGTFIALTRTATGFHGASVADAFTQRGTRCRVSFPTELLACGDGGLLLRAASSGAVDEQCREPTNAQPSARMEHRLVRYELLPLEVVDAGAGVFGGVDAGRIAAIDGGS